MIHLPESLENGLARRKEFAQQCFSGKGDRGFSADFAGHVSFQVIFFYPVFLDDEWGFGAGMARHSTI